MDRTRRAALNEQIYEEACEWFLEFRDGVSDAATRTEFDLWVRRSPDHLSAYLEIAAIWNEAPRLESADASALIARASQDAENIVPLNVGGLSAAIAEHPRQQQSFPPYTLTAASFLIVFLLGAAGFWLSKDPVYSTGIGEQRAIALEDGSRVELNSRSKLKIHYSKGERGVELIEGQALFSVAKDSMRPFVVSSGNARVRAVGTQFDVYRKRKGTVVTVVEGKVAIRDDSNSLVAVNAAHAAPVLVTAGHQLVVTGSEIEKPVAANVVNVTAWRQQRLAFDGAALSEVVEEFNRYNKRQLVIRGGTVVDFRVSGVFSSADPVGLIRFLRDRSGIRVIESPSQIVIERIKKTDVQNNGI